MSAFDFAAQLGAQSLLSVTDGKDGKAAVKHTFRRTRAAVVHNRGWSARQNHPFGLHPVKGFFGGVERCNLAIDTRFAHAAGNQLRYL